MKKKMLRKIAAVGVMLCLVGSSAAALAAAKATIHSAEYPSKAEAQLTPSPAVKKVRIDWQPLPNAVFYELLILDGADPFNSRIMLRRSDISVTGVELNLRFRQSRDSLYWRVRSLDINKQPLSEYTAPAPLGEQTINPQSVRTTTEYGSLKYMKAYPVFSWIPVNDADYYTLQVFRDIDFKESTPDRIIKSIRITGASDFDYYDTEAYVQAGRYWWRIRGMKNNGQAATDWSERDYFVVRRGAKVAALGDSITHGGGAVSVPPSNLAYDWESYTGMDIKNLGYSGNTVEAMLERFDNDVLSDKPNVLVIMGGINNIRLGDKAEQVISGLQTLKQKCQNNGIKPLFVTIAPINPAKMKLVSGLDTAATWKAEQLKINDWIKKQPYHLDITAPLSDRRGWLKDELATDGLHPDIEGKRMIGMAIGNYIEETFDL